MNSISIDERLRADPLTLPHIRRAIPRECLTPIPRRSWGTLLRIYACCAACLWLLSLVRPDWNGDRWSLVAQLAASMILWVVYGWVLVGLFVVGHDCGHRSFSRRGWVNAVVGHICMAPLANSFHAWRLTHDHHHAYTQLRGQDVDWASYLMTRDEYASTTTPPPLITRLGYALPFGILLWITWNALRRGFAIQHVLPSQQYTKERRRLRQSSLITLGTLSVIYGGLWYATGFWGMLHYHGIPAAVAMVTGWMIIAIQHASEDALLYEKPAWTPAKGQMVSTFDIRFPSILEYAWCSINIHIPHHVAPGVPWYHLKRAAHALQRAYPDHYQEQRFGMRHLAWFRRTPFLRKVDDKGYYVVDVSTAA
jgi:omega-6 fatty acid desaturase (delta-12 desaturase)